MRFFVPSVTDRQEAEAAYRSIRDRVAGMAGQVSDRRIYRLKFRDRDEHRVVVVGSDRHGLGNGPVLAIFEGSDDRFYVCTHKQNQVEAEPHTIDKGAVVETEEFTALG
jgi:hypothetical protein